jgi:hypothetical protein
MNHSIYPIGQKKRRPKLLKNKGNHTPDVPAQHCSLGTQVDFVSVDAENSIIENGEELSRPEGRGVEESIRNPKERNRNLPQFPIGFAKERPKLPRRRKINANLPAFPLGKKLIKRPRKTRIPNRKLPQYPIGKKWIKRVIVPRSHKISIFSDTPISRSGFLQIVFDSPSIVISKAVERDADDPIIENIGINVNALVNMFTFAPSPDE